MGVGGWELEATASFASSNLSSRTRRGIQNMLEVIEHEQ